jgi:Tfp pilus assembly protein PilN
MQYINLLPQNMRPKATTPLKVIASVYVGVAVSFSLLMWALYLQVGVLPIKKSAVDTIRQQIKNLAKDVEDHDRLQASIKQMVKKDDIATDLKSRRVKWGRKLDLVWDVVANSRSTWIRDLKVVERKVKMKVGARKTVEVSTPILTLKLRSGNFEKRPSILNINSEKLIENFLDSYRFNDELMSGFELVLPETWKFVDQDFSDKQRLYLDYEIKMRALPYDEKSGSRKKGAVFK